MHLFCFSASSLSFYIDLFGATVLDDDEDDEWIAWQPLETVSTHKDTILVTRDNATAAQDPPANENNHDDNGAQNNDTAAAAQPGNEGDTTEAGNAAVNAGIIVSIPNARRPRRPKRSKNDVLPDLEGEEAEAAPAPARNPIGILIQAFGTEGDNDDDDMISQISGPPLLKRPKDNHYSSSELPVEVSLAQEDELN